MPTYGRSPYGSLDPFAGTYWNTPLPSDAPIDPTSAAVIAYIKATYTNFNYPRLFGVEPTDSNPHSQEQAQPVYQAVDADPTYNVTTRQFSIPSEFSALHIPDSVSPNYGDLEITVYQPRQYVAWLFGAVKSGSDWSVLGGSVTHYDTNGLAGSVTGGDSRNTGHRGVPAHIVCARWKHVVNYGLIPHMLNWRIKNPSSVVWPMYDGGSGTDSVIEGSVFRIKRSVDLSARGLSAKALVIATCMQDYGFIAGDASLSNTTVFEMEARGSDWQQYLHVDSLSPITFDDFELIQLGWTGKVTLR